MSRPASIELAPNPFAAIDVVYAGIGSRTTPPSILRVMRQFATEAARLGWTLRSGGAGGADETFEDAATDAGGSVECFHPWPGFRAHERARQIRPTLERPTAAALAVAADAHPAWSRLSRGARALHARNAHQILGADLHTPSDVIVCWTPDGSLDGSSRESGGTGQALRIAARHGVPVLNLARPEHRRMIETILPVAA
ncbi:hypothetical protein C8N24_0321 [Solirubrobacter pauli]|uniref:DNA recombination-mediator protein A n=1 Tax=Solirubrobacter pauli TaxID=166793 RepID=A0A660L822_9ACTN|nr:hypothetical protein [Solirubrobacter pauli]RKQ90516.1 hypothetical protein C8N24_0321 [Solirubrobacter pauli]